jgi:hypothetical protein
VLGWTWSVWARLFQFQVQFQIQTEFGVYFQCYSVSVFQFVDVRCLMFHVADAFPYGAIGPVQFQWKPTVSR